jgi:DNA mismatch endonuclease (patch repair protein)
MPDIFSPLKRSKIMSNIKWQNTKVERLVFRYLRAQDIYFQKHYRRAPGSPDIALPRNKKAVFIDGDFWHGRYIEDIRKKRGVNDFWTLKISSNVIRDLKKKAQLDKLGWKYISIWESDINRKRTQQAELEKIAKFLKN